MATRMTYEEMLRRDLGNVYEQGVVGDDGSGWLAALDAALAPQQEPTYDEPQYDQSYDSGPQYIYEAPPPPIQLNTDPGWLGLMAEIDRQSSGFDAEAKRQSGLATSQRDRLLGDLGPRGDLEREGIAGGYESRGLFGGGAMAQATARQQANQERRATGISADAAGRVSDIEGQLAIQKAELERQRASTRMDFLSRGYV